MFWADQIADSIEKRFATQIADGIPLRIRDEKTLSGRVHVGSLRGVAIHGMIHEVLNERGIANEYLFELNDIDPLDDLPSYVDQEKYRPLMGQPLYSVPAPDDSTAKSFPEHWGNEFVDIVHSIGFTPTFYSIRNVYEQGAFNDAIRIALEHARDIRSLYKEVSGSEKPDDWMPLQVVCEECGKSGSTKVTSFDGNKVSYVCMPDMVTWAIGCGHGGSVEPWNGRSKLPWKVEWAAKFAYLPRPIDSSSHYGVDIEGAGKDHATKGGSRDIANMICEKIFNHPSPFDVPYNFFVVGGKKMSSSKGLGSSSKAIADLLPPELMRLLLIRKQPKHEIDFDPTGNTIPTLFDEFDRVAEKYFDTSHPRNDDPVRFFHFSQMPEKRSSVKNTYRPRFGLVSFMVQMPHIDIEAEIAHMKTEKEGNALTDDDKATLDERTRYARQWLDTCVPDEYKFTLQETLPSAAQELSDVQRAVLTQLHAFLIEHPDATGEDIHARLHALKEELHAQPKDIFEAIYIVFLNKKSGPQAGWFIKSLDRAFVLNRLNEMQ